MARYDYDLITIGGGAAGLTAAGMAASLGARTLMVERHRLGGDCTWTGCVPSKALLKVASVAHEIRSAGTYGLTIESPVFDASKVMDHVRAVRRQIYHDADEPEQYRSMGVAVQFGEAHFVDPHTIEVRQEGAPVRVTGRYFVIATGSRARVPSIEGVDRVPYLTNENVFELERPPRSLLVVGAGPMGIELAQAFTRLGVAVTAIDVAGRILAHDEADHARRLQASLAAEGIRFVLGAEILQVGGRVDGGVEATVRVDGSELHLDAAALLVAAGRRANVDGLRLDAAGVAFTRDGVSVNRHARTNVRHIYAAGDVTGRYQLTHMSEHMARVAVSNALLKLPLKIDTRHVPWVTFTDPALGHVGATTAMLDDAGKEYHVFRFPYEKLDRAVTDRAACGEVRVYASRLRGKILGASVLGERAGEIVSELALAMRRGVTLRHLSDTIHPYPTYALAARRVADQWYVRHRSPLMVRAVKALFRYRGTVRPFDPEDVV